MSCCQLVAASFDQFCAQGVAACTVGCATVRDSRRIVVAGAVGNQEATGRVAASAPVAKQCGVAWHSACGCTLPMARGVLQG